MCRKEAESGKNNKGLKVVAIASSSFNIELLKFYLVSSLCKSQKICFDGGKRTMKLTHFPRALATNNR
jgi:hypothetical protein